MTRSDSETVTACHSDSAQAGSGRGPSPTRTVLKRGYATSFPPNQVRARMGRPARPSRTVTVLLCFINTDAGGI